MAAPTKNKWLTLSLLAIILPVTLLVTFKLTGVIPEPQTPETTTLEPVCWNMSRPSDDDILINEWTNNSYVDCGVAVVLGVHILKYYEHDPGPPAEGNDYLSLRVVVTAEVDDGFVHSIVMTFSASDSYAFLGVLEDPSFMELRNAKLGDIHDFGAGEIKAHLKASCINQPENCSLSILSSWIFVEKEVDHLITVSLEVTYYNGSAYERVEIPINLRVLKD
jgi:hypothetical protein